MARIKPPTSIPVNNNPALKRLDANQDGQVNAKDFKNLTDDEKKGAMLAAAALAEPGVETAPDGFDLAGKKVVFTGLERMSKSDAKKLAEDAGANVASGLSRGVDVLVVGDDDKTSKDEKAIQMNASGLASIRLMSETDFKNIANAATATNVLDIAGHGAPFEATFVNDTDDYMQVSSAMKKKVHDAMADAAQEYFEAFGEDSGFESVAAARDSFGEIAVDSISDDSITFVAGYGYGAFFAEVDRKSGDVTDSYEFS